MDRLRTLPVLALGAFALLLSGCGDGNAFHLISTGYGSFCGLIHIVFVVVALVKIANSNADTGLKLLWAAAVFFFPFLGLIAWWIWGPKS